MTKVILIGATILCLFLFLLWQFDVFSNVGTTKPTKPQLVNVSKTLTNHEKRIIRLEKKDKEQDYRLEKHAGAIEDLQEQINGLDKSKKNELQPKNKYSAEGWDYPDFPENW